GLGGCIIGSIERQGFRRGLDIPSDYEIVLVIAIGKPREEIVIETIPPGKDIKYWRDKKDVHHVPKRALDDIIIGT
ncbi:MAG: nitroreductase, partial [Candidatus Omnitrophota bacterium]